MRERIDDLLSTIQQKEKTLIELREKYNAVKKRLDATLLALSRPRTHKVKVIKVRAPKKPKYIPLKRTSKELLPVDHIIETVCNYFNITKEQITQPGKPNSLVIPRHYAFYFLAVHTTLSYRAIGEMFSGRTHATVMNGLWYIQQLKSDRQLNELRELLKKES